MAQRVPGSPGPPVEDASFEAGNATSRAGSCRLRATDARQLAEVALDPAGREAFLKVAARWDHMAEQLERLGKPDSGRPPR